MSLFLVILSASWLAFSIAGLTATLRVRSDVHKALGRKVKWNNYVPVNIFDLLFQHLVTLAVGMLFSWWLMGIVTLSKDFNLYALPEYIKNLREFNEFTGEENQKLEKYLAENIII